MAFIATHLLSLPPSAAAQLCTMQGCLLDKLARVSSAMNRCYMYMYMYVHACMLVCLHVCSCSIDPPPEAGSRFQQHKHR